jgi:hypothetical protein
MCARSGFILSLICEPGVGRFPGRPFAIIETPKRLTRYMATPEILIPQPINERSVASDERKTGLIFRTMRNTSRVAKRSTRLSSESTMSKGVRIETFQAHNH